MAYSDFSLERVARDFSIKVRWGSVFETIGRMSPPEWLVELLARYRALAFQNEKSRSEFLVAPVLVACREMVDNRVYLYSGVGLDVDPARGLAGACDFILAPTAPTPVLEPPLLMIVEAKRDNLDLGAGQCGAQLVAARLFNEHHNRKIRPLWGCVTTGDLWQFVKLEDNDLVLHEERLFLGGLDQVTWAIVTILKNGLAQAGAAA